MQLIIVILAVAMAIAYAAWRFSKTISTAAGSCCGCDCCVQKGIKQGKEYCS